MKNKVKLLISDNSFIVRKKIEELIFYWIKDTSFEIERINGKILNIVSLEKIIFRLKESLSIVSLFEKKIVILENINFLNYNFIRKKSKIGTLFLNFISWIKNFIDHNFFLIITASNAEVNKNITIFKDLTHNFEVIYLLNKDIKQSSILKKELKCLEVFWKINILMMILNIFCNLLENDIYKILLELEKCFLFLDCKNESINKHLIMQLVDNNMISIHNNDYFSFIHHLFSKNYDLTLKFSRILIIKNFDIQYLLLLLIQRNKSLIRILALKIILMKNNISFNDFIDLYKKYLIQNIEFNKKIFNLRELFNECKHHRYEILIQLQIYLYNKLSFYTSLNQKKIILFYIIKFIYH